MRFNKVSSNVGRVPPRMHIDPGHIGPLYPEYPEYQVRMPERPERRVPSLLNLNLEQPWDQQRPPNFYDSSPPSAAAVQRYHQFAYQPHVPTNGGLHMRNGKIWKTKYNVDREATLCKHCNRVVNRISRHMQRHHQKKDWAFECPHCYVGVSRLDQAKMVQHLIIFHPTKTTKVGDTWKFVDEGYYTPTQCLFDGCAKEFIGMAAVDRHMRSMHGLHLPAMMPAAPSAAVSVPPASPAKEPVVVSPVKSTVMAPVHVPASRWLPVTFPAYVPTPLSTLATASCASAAAVTPSVKSEPLSFGDSLSFDSGFDGFDLNLNSTAVTAELNTVAPLTPTLPDSMDIPVFSLSPTYPVPPLFEDILDRMEAADDLSSGMKFSALNSH